MTTTTQNPSAHGPTTQHPTSHDPTTTSRAAAPASSPSQETPADTATGHGRRRVLVTGATRGLGRALALALLDLGDDVVASGRDAAGLGRLRAEAASRPGTLHTVAGDLCVERDRRRLLDHAGDRDVLVLNAGTLGPSPLPAVRDLDPADLRDVLEVNVVAQHALLRRVLRTARPGATVVTLSSDAAVEAYPGWGAYGASKAALDHLLAVAAAEHGEHRLLAFDPGDMRTDMHQAAFPGEDISDRPLPEETAVPALLALLASDCASGRCRAGDVRATIQGVPA